MGHENDGTLRVRCRKSSFYPVSAILRQYPPDSTEPLLADRG